MEKLIDKIELDKINLNIKWMYCCRNCNNTEYDINYLENKKCPICNHRYDVPISEESKQQIL